MLTHRCEKSLKAGASIRYDFEFGSMGVVQDYKAWRMFNYEYDFEDVINKYFVAEIEYCPFCGEKMNKESLK